VVKDDVKFCLQQIILEFKLFCFGTVKLKHSIQGNLYFVNGGLTYIFIDSKLYLGRIDEFLFVRLTKMSVKPRRIDMVILADGTSFNPKNYVFEKDWVKHDMDGEILPSSLHIENLKKPQNDVDYISTLALLEKWYKAVYIGRQIWETD
jgi:hypothetical protein